MSAKCPRGVGVWGCGCDQEVRADRHAVEGPAGQCAAAPGRRVDVIELQHGSGQHPATG